MALAFIAALRNGMLDQITSQVGASGKLRIYTTPRPATGAAIGGATQLAELTLNATFAPAASGGVLTLNSITADSAADATGTAVWFRLWKSDGTTAVVDGNVGTSGSDLNLNTTAIVTGATVSVTSFTITAGNP